MAQNCLSWSTIPHPHEVSDSILTSASQDFDSCCDSEVNGVEDQQLSPSFKSADVREVLDILLRKASCYLPANSIDDDLLGTRYYHNAANFSFLSTCGKSLIARHVRLQI